MNLFTFSPKALTHIQRHYRQVLLVVLFFTISSYTPYNWNQNNFDSWEWTEVNENANWQPRAGLQVVNLRNKFYLFGGRTPLDPTTLPFPVPNASTIWGDVWRSNDGGQNWSQILETDNEGHWPARAYFQAVTKGNYMYVLGGQNFNIVENPGIPDLPPFYSQSDFFNDVWRSRDGIHWNKMTENAPWPERAGLSAVVHRGYIYVMGGSVNDDSSITPQGPARIYYNDVWRSRNGRIWKKLTDNAEWAPRAGGVVVSKNGYLYMMGGEDGFTCNPQNPRCPPYYNDVWRSRNGRNWQLVTEEAEWSARPGHQVLVVKNKFVLFGGFGLDPNFDPINNPFNPYVPSNPMDVWESRNGSNWNLVEGFSWNANSPADIKYDFDALVVRGRHNRGTAIYTFGGDRETFDFFDPLNYTNVDNDIWKFSLPNNSSQEDRVESIANLDLIQNYPNPFLESTNISYHLSKDSDIILNIYDIHGRLIKELVRKHQKAGSYEIKWDGSNSKNQNVKKGIYIGKILIGSESRSIKMILK